jgi:hypothetical protein
MPRWPQFPEAKEKIAEYDSRHRLSLYKTVWHAYNNSARALAHIAFVLPVLIYWRFQND